MATLRMDPSRERTGARVLGAFGCEDALCGKHSRRAPSLVGVEGTGRGRGQPSVDRHDTNDIRDRRDRYRRRLGDRNVGGRARDDARGQIVVIVDVVDGMSTRFERDDGKKDDEPRGDQTLPLGSSA